MNNMNCTENCPSCEPESCPIVQYCDEDWLYQSEDWQARDSEYSQKLWERDNRIAERAMR